MAGNLQHNVPAPMLRANSPMPVSDGHDEVANLREQLRHQQQIHREMLTMFKKKQILAIKMFQSKWQMVCQKVHAFITKTCSQSEDFVRAELMAVQRLAESLQRQYVGHLRSHVHALQDECRDHVGQEEDKLRKELQKALTQKSNMCRDQLHQTLRHQTWQEDYADEVSHREIAQLCHLVIEQEDAMVRLEATSKRAFSHQYEEYAQKRQALLQEFDGAIKDKDDTVHALKQELANSLSAEWIFLDSGWVSAWSFVPGLLLVILCVFLGTTAFRIRALNFQ